MIKPPHLSSGDIVAVVSTSSGTAVAFPHLFQQGLSNLERTLDVTARCFPTTTMSSDQLFDNPSARARDLNDAFRDPEISAIFVTIGGDDSARILPFLDRQVALDNPKILMGFSDTTTQLSFYNQAGLVTFHGPSVMAGFAQIDALEPRFADDLRTMLCKSPSSFSFAPFGNWHAGYTDWSVPVPARVKEAVANRGPRWLQGRGVVEGRLFGGCLDVLHFFNGTAHWPEPSFWDGRLLFVETSEEAPSPLQVKRWLRNFGLQGILQRISALMIGRPRGYSNADKGVLEREVLDLLNKEFDLTDLTVVADMDFGHTDPQWVMPLGVMARLDFDSQSFRLIESPTTP